MARIESHKYSIEEAFRECFYIVPDYQREYVWTDKEVHQILEDINEQIDAGSTRESCPSSMMSSSYSQSVADHISVDRKPGAKVTACLKSCPCPRFSGGTWNAAIPTAWSQRMCISELY